MVEETTSSKLVKKRELLHLLTEWKTVLLLFWLLFLPTKCILIIYIGSENKNFYDFKEQQLHISCKCVSWRSNRQVNIFYRMNLFYPTVSAVRSLERNIDDTHLHPHTVDNFCEGKLWFVACISVREKLLQAEMVVKTHWIKSLLLITLAFEAYTFSY